MRKIFSGSVMAFILATSAVSAVASDLIDTAVSSGTFKTFIAAVKAAGMTASLKSSGPFTVFAPSDEAFAKLPPGALDALLKDKPMLAEVLSYHVVPGTILVADVKPGKLKTVQGKSLTLTSDNGKIKVDDANVTESDVHADNGIIHVIDTVMMPK